MDYLMNVVNESPIHTMMYHGSDLELDRLKPTAYNAGHRLKSHSWSVFLWPTFELAYKWAAFVTCRNLGRALKGKVDKWRPLGEHIKTGFNKYEFKVYVHREAYDTVRKYICDQEPMFYVYTVNTPVDTNFGIGNNNIQPEYSYDGELSIYHKEEYQLTERLFEEIFEPCDEAKYQELKAFKGENIRGPIGILFYPSDDVVKRWSFVYKRVQQGAIKPGDDLDPVIAEYEQHEELTKQSIIMSQDDLYLNYEKWESGESHSLMVYGLSGSGKSTLGQKIADENDAHYVSTDVIGFMIVGPRNAAKGRTTYEFIRKTDIMLYTFFKLYNIPPDVLADIEYDPVTKTCTPEDEQRKRDLADKFIHWLVFEQKEKVVIEGSYTGVTITNHPDDYKDIPIIFKGTSLLKSVHRRAIRNLKNGDPIEAIHLIIKIKSQYLDHMMPEVNAARSTMLKDRYDYRLVKEDLIDEASSPYHIKFKRSTDGLLNPITTINGRDYRPRAEILLLDENDNLLIRKHEGINQYGTTYKLPGGGFDNPGETPEDVAYRECCEEVRIIPKDVVFSDIIYVVEYGDRIPEWHKKKLWPSGIKYVGAVSFVCVGRYDKKYHKYVRKIDQEPSMEEFKFYPIDSLSHILRDEHKQAIRDYLTHTEGTMKFGELDIDAPNPHVKHKKHKIPVPSNIKDFKDFCTRIPNPEVSMAWFIKNKVKWTPHGGSNDHPFQWPDYLIKQKMGNCFDQTIFMHYYCQKKRIDHRMFLITWISDKGEGTGHAVPMYMKGKYVYIWLYFRPGVGTIAGPYRSYEEAKTTLDYYFSVAMNRLFKSPTYAYSSFISSEDMARFDEYYNDRSITQTQYICDGLGANLRSTHMVKLKYKGFTFPNPAVPIYDVVITAIQLLKFANNLVPTREDTDLIEEIYLDHDIDKSMDPLKLNPSKDYRDFNDFCSKVHTIPMMLKWFIDNVSWPDPIVDLRITWPDELVKTKIGVCTDHAIFMYYFCKRLGLASRLMQVLWADKDDKCLGGHAGIVFRYRDKYYCPFFLPKCGWIAGPYNTWDEARLNFQRVMEGYGNYYVRQPTYTYSVLLEDEDHKVLDKYYNKPVSQDIFDGCTNLTYYRLHYKGYSAPDPMVWVADVMKAAAERILYHREKSWVESVEEAGADSKYTKNYRDFNEFCANIHTPYEVLNWYRVNFVRWNSPDKDGHLNRKPFTWPDDMIKTKTGNCGDHAIFMHYFCERHHIPNYIIRLTRNWLTRDSNEYHIGQHFTCVFKDDAGWFGFDYSGGPMRADRARFYSMHSALSGPYPSAEAYAEESARVMDHTMSRMGLPNLRKVEKCEYHFLTKENLELLDRLYGRHDVMQIDYYMMIRKDIQSKYDFKTYEEDDPIDWAMNKIQLGLYKAKSLIAHEDTTFITEAKDIYVDRFGNKKAKGDSIYIGTDANASESEYLKRVEYIRLSTIRNGTPQPVIMKNGGSYRARCEVIVLKGNKILLDRGKNRGGFGYTLPGGGIDPREKVAKGAARECEEEALVKPKHVKFMNVVWWGEFENPLFNKGSVSMVCVAEFGSYYDESKVKQEDRDEFADRAQWEDYRTANLGEPHMIAIERYFGRDVKPKTICTLEETITEAKLKPEERTNYGLPKKKKYPMPDKAHVLQAIRMFNHCDPEDEEELARNIIKNMKKYNMKDVKVGKNNRFHKYYHPDNKALDESLRMESYKVTAFINESIRLLEMAGGGGPVIGMEINDQSVQFSTPGQFLINFSDTPDTRKNDYAISNDLSSKYIYRKKKDKYIKEDATTFLKDKTIRIYRFLGEQSLWLTLLRDIDINVCDEETSVYEDLTGKKELSYDQIDYDNSFEYFDLSKYLLESSMFKTTVDLETAKLHGDKRYEFTLPNQDLSKRYIIKEDQKGQFLYDQLTGNRSPSLTRR